MEPVTRNLGFAYTLDPSGRLIEEFALFLAQKYAKIFAGGPNNPKFQDWFQAAAEGVCEAARRWNVCKSNGAAFTSYAHYWILATARKYGLLGAPSRAEGFKVIFSDLTDLLEVGEERPDFGRDIFIKETDIPSLLLSLLDLLDEDDKFLLQLRFGLPPFTRTHTFEEIASIYGLSEVGTAWNRVRRAVRRLGGVVKRKGLWSVLRDYLESVESAR